MALVVIGGHSRGVGKTSVVAGLISALPDFEWTAVKITQYGHGICSADGAACDCATGDHSWAISEERDRSGESDTSRFLTAGAVRVFWARTEQGRLAEAMPTLRKRLEGARNVIVESNSVLKFLASGPLPDSARSSNSRFQDLRPRISGPRRWRDLARNQRRPCMAVGFPEARGGAPHIPHPGTPLRDAGNRGLCPRKASDKRGTKQPRLIAGYPSNPCHPEARVF